MCVMKKLQRIGQEVPVALRKEGGRQKGTESWGHELPWIRWKLFGGAGPPPCTARWKTPCLTETLSRLLLIRRNFLSVSDLEHHSL